MTEITSEEAFREAKFARDGYIVITDTTGNKIHMPRCDDVKISDFREKVLNNEKRNGRYYFVEDLVAGIEEFRAKKCQNCKPR